MSAQTTIVEALVAEYAEQEAQLARTRSRLYGAIREAHAELGVAAPDLARMTGLSRQRIWQILNGRRT